MRKLAVKKINFLFSWASWNFQPAFCISHFALIQQKSRNNYRKKLDKHLRIHEYRIIARFRHWLPQIEWTKCVWNWKWKCMFRVQNWNYYLTHSLTRHKNIYERWEKNYHYDRFTIEPRLWKLLAHLSEWKRKRELDFLSWTFSNEFISRYSLSIYFY